jgi:hypothetical protein
VASEVGQLLQQWLGDARALAAQHAQLAREELRTWLARVGPQLAMSLVFAPGIAVGLLLAGIGVALVLGRYVPLPLAFAAAGVLAAAPGLVALVVLVRAVQRAPTPLSATRSEVAGTLQSLRASGGRT